MTGGQGWDFITDGGIPWEQDTQRSSKVKGRRRPSRRRRFVSVAGDTTDVVSGTGTSDRHRVKSYLPARAAAAGWVSASSSRGRSRRQSMITCDTTAVRPVAQIEYDYVQPRPGCVQPPWTYRSRRKHRRRRYLRRRVATSNTSRVEGFLSNNGYQVSFFFMSSFRDSPVYPGRIGRDKIPHQKQPLQSLSRQIPTSRGDRYSVGQGGRNWRCAR